MVLARLDLALSIAFIDAAAAAGQGMLGLAAIEPLKILEDDLGKAFESAEDGRFGDGMSAHDVLQSVERMISYAKKGKHYFSDDEE